MPVAADLHGLVDGIPAQAAPTTAQQVASIVVAVGLPSHRAGGVGADASASAIAAILPASTPSLLIRLLSPS